MVEAALADERAFRAIVDRHKAMVYSIGHSFFQNRETAEDLAQDVFFELFRHLWSIESDLHLTNWLRQAMTRRCIDQARWRRLHAQQSLEDAAEPGAAATPPDPFLAREVRQKILALPDRKRMVVILRFQEEMELEEIARVMEMPLNTVKSTLHRALAVLKRRLGSLRSEYGTARR
jgi:RNA polymerase sigma-70 factor (ECF subfamily)